MFKVKENCAIVREEVRSADGMEYRYTLSARRSEKTSSFGLTLYSIKAELIDKDGRHSEASLVDAFRSPEAAFGFFERIADNLATPIDLPFVFEDEKA